MIRRDLLALAATLCLPTAVRAAGRPVTVFAAASLQNVLEEVGAAWTAQSGTPVRFSFAASSAIARQIEQGAPADIFISADAEWMDYVAERGLILARSRADLLTNRLALIASAGTKTQIAVGRGMALARALGAGERLAMAAPQVPAGRYAEAALRSLGVWDRVSARTARGENVRAALAFVARGEAPLGVVYDTDAKVEPKVRIVGLFPAGSHPRIVYPAAVVAGSARSGASAFLAYLRGRRAGGIFAKYGFARP